MFLSIIFTARLFSLDHLVAEFYLVFLLLLLNLTSDTVKLLLFLLKPFLLGVGDV